MDKCHTELVSPVVYEGQLCGVSRWLAPEKRGQPHTSQQKKDRGREMVVGQQSLLGFWDYIAGHVSLKELVSRIKSC